MKKRIINKGLIFLFILAAVLSIKGIDVKAKTYKSIPNGGYISEFKSAKISNGKLVIKGTVTNWERADNTNAYKKAGTHKLKLSKKCEILDGYKPSYSISKKKFNKLCKKKDDLHESVAFMVEKKKVTMIRFW